MVLMDAYWRKKNQSDFRQFCREELEGSKIGDGSGLKLPPTSVRWRVGDGRGCRLDFNATNFRWMAMEVLIIQPTFRRSEGKVLIEI
jgi:hypothetical protein